MAEDRIPLLNEDADESEVSDVDVDASGKNSCNFSELVDNKEADMITVQFTLTSKLKSV